MVCDARMLYDAADLETRPLPPLRAGLVCRKGHPILAHKRPTEQILPLPLRPPARSALKSAAPGGNVSRAARPEQMVTHRCENLDALVELTLRSDALLLGVICVTRRQQEAGQLIEVPIAPDPQRQGHYALALLAGRTPLTAQDALYDFTRECWDGFASFRA